MRLTWNWQGWSRDGATLHFTPHFHHIIARDIGDVADEEIATATGGDGGDEGEAVQ